MVGLFVADRELTLCTIPEVLDPAPGFGESLATVLADIGADTLDAIVWQLMLDEPSLFRQPTAPLGEMLEAAGYVRDGDYVAVDGFDFEAYHLANRARMLEVRENLHPEEAASVIAFVDLVMAAKVEVVEDVSDWARKQVKEDPQAFAGIAEPPAAAAALELLSELDDHDSVLHSVATALAEKGSRRVKPQRTGWRARLRIVSARSLPPRHRTKLRTISIPIGLPRSSIWRYWRPIAAM
ncbi:hypothetical protein GCM10020255_110110 [Rhodococcus baikonurensis]